jgi:BirA family biotin operon repressor/biotin-[acetyl-CoA-carboxylase] ligase
VGGSLQPDAVLPLLRGRFGRDYRYLERCPSTQRELSDDAAEGALAATDEQTEGRGRLGKSWLAPPGTSVLCSIVLRPPVRAERLPELMPVAGRACAEAIAAVARVEPTVKFPNDVLVGGRKVAGVLAEAVDGRVVLGVGINVDQRADQLPPGANATSLALETGRDLDRAGLLAEFLARLETRYDEWVSDARDD